MALTLYNTLGRKLETFRPLEQGRVGLYGCGPTVYSDAHIGNLRPYVVHDILGRTLRRRGYELLHVMNITDVGHLSGDNDEGEDKMVKSAAQRGESVLEVADLYTRAFFRDTERMNIRRPGVVCKATEHIPEMIDLIKRIEARGFSYEAGGNLYFDIAKFPRYGDLRLPGGDSRSPGGDLGLGQNRTGLDKNKRNPQDFALWFTKSKFENQALVWDSPWGRGYPGWHIECSAMSIKYLGEQFDIHAGGVDHVPIHHTNEIAQSEAATGKHPWVRYWLHNEFLVMDKGKMSKSSGGFITLQSLIDEGWEALDYRYLLLSGHYRSQLQFSREALEGARNARKALGDRVRALAAASAALEGPDAPPGGRRSPPDGLRASARVAAFDAALDEDLSTPKALAELWGLVRDKGVNPQAALRGALDMDTVLGLGLAEEAAEAMGLPMADPGFDREIEGVIAERAAAKQAGDYARADALREALKDRGVVLEDGKAGTVWRRS
ncbi:MAG: cysteine--tRNA ligase [Treponema sp.]|jgi:cysteinyl-tRNA synthetase|nr:cysteine--tRNA ligase [Treponema sp.]